MPKSAIKVWDLIGQFYQEKYDEQKLLIKNCANNLSSRLFAENCSGNVERIEVNEESSSDLEKAISFYTSESSSKTNDGTLSKDLKLFEGTGEKTNRLKHLHKSLLSIKPTSTVCERAFSVAGNFKTKIRNRLAPTKLNWLLWLKFYFLAAKK